MSTELKLASTTIDDRATCRMSSTVLAGAEKTAAVTKVRWLERELFDDDGHIRRDVTPAQAEQIAAVINDLRDALGWLEIGLDGRWRWPSHAHAALTERQRVA